MWLRFRAFLGGGGQVRDEIFWVNYVMCKVYRVNILKCIVFVGYTGLLRVKLYGV